MYCKNCGAYNSEEAKYCSSCGTELNRKNKPLQDEYQDFFEEQPRQNSYGYNDNNQDDFFSDRSSNEFGSKFEPSAVGNVRYGNRKIGIIGKVIRFFFIAGIISFVYTTFSDEGFSFFDESPIYDVAIGTEINSETYYPDEPIDYVIASEGILYFSYSASDIQYETIFVKIVSVDNNDYIIYSESIVIDYEEQVGYFSYNYNWTVGEYAVVFEYDDEEVYVLDFTVETE